MNKKNIFLIFFIVIIILISSVSVFSVSVTDSHGESFTNPSSQSANNLVGVLIQTKYNLTLINMTFYGSITADTWYVYHMNGTALVGGTINGTKTNLINYTLENDTYYRLVVSKNAGFNGGQTNTGVTPDFKTNINYINGTYKVGAGAWTNVSQYFGIESVTTENITYPASPETINITFINQTPTDLTNTNLFSTNGTLRIIYNVTNMYNGTPIIYLNYTTNNSRNYFEITNGTVTDPTLEVLRYKQSNLGVSANNQYIYDINADNDIYPSVNLLPLIYFITTSHTRYTINGTNDYLKFALYNMSFENSQYLELDLKSNNSICRIFYCNGSYSNGNLISTSNNCFHFATSSNQTTYNHTHGANVGHNLYAFTLNSSGYIGTVKVSENGFFAINKQTGTACDIGLIPNITRTNTTELTLTGGSLYTVLNYTPDTHLHFFNTTFPDNFKYQLCVTNGTNDTCSSFRTDNLDITNFPPIINIITPNNESINITSRYYNITWSYILTGASNVNFSVFLYNSTNDLVRNLSINQSNTSFYNWDIVSSNITQGTYYVGIYGLDNNSLTGFEFGDTFYIYNNAEVNVTAKYYFNNATISNFNITLYDFNSSLYAYYNGTSYSELNIIKGHSYNILIDHPTYSYISYNFTTNTNFNNITFYLNITNSVYILIYDANTLNLINASNTQITFLSTNSTFNYVTANGTYLATNITPNIYTITINNSNYSPTSYTITINADTSQQLNVYLNNVNSTSLIFFYIQNSASEPLNATVNIQKLINTSFVTIGNKQTDLTGFVYFYLIEQETYKITISSSGYDTRTFDFEPFAVNSPYLIRLSPTSITSFTNIFEEVDFLITPTNISLPVGTNTFSIQTSSINGVLIYTYINCNGNISNLSGFPNGATASVDVTTLTSSTIYCTYKLSATGYNDVTLYNNYNIKTTNTATQTNLIDTMENLKNDLGNNGSIWTTIIAFLIIIGIAGTFLGLTGNSLVVTFVVFAGITGFAILGWIDKTIAFFTVAIALLTYYLYNRGV